MSETTRSTTEMSVRNDLERPNEHSVEIRLGRPGEIKVDDDVYSLNIDTTSEEI